MELIECVTEEGFRRVIDNIVNANRPIILVREDLDDEMQLDKMVLIAEGVHRQSGRICPVLRRPLKGYFECQTPIFVLDLDHQASREFLFLSDIDPDEIISMVERALNEEVKDVI